MNEVMVVFCFCFSIYGAKSLPKSDNGLSTPEMIRNHDYPVETHYIKTEDRYILQVHRIPHGIKANTTDNKRSIFLMHGLFSSSADWVNMGPDRSLGYILADLGYDVWIGNARGTHYSRNHTTLDPDMSAEFWDFSFHEIGYYDLPAMIDYMLNKTGDKNCYYIGHSQGTTSLLVLLSTRIEYNTKIRLALLLATAGFMENSKFFKTFSILLDPFINLFNYLGIYETPLGFLSRFGMNYCDYAGFQSICVALLTLMSWGDDIAQIDLSLIPTIFSNAPSSAAMKQMYHYQQLVNSRKFRQYDLGIEENLKKYGSEIPPDYNLSLVTAPVAIYSGLNDGVVHYKDSNVVAGKVSHLVENYIIPYKAFNHLDFLFAKDVVQLFYKKLLNDLQHFSIN